MLNDPLQILFLIVAFVILAASILTVTVQNLVHAALWMILSFFFVAVLYVMIGSGYFAVIQVVIYIGAIALLILFAIMLTRRESNEQELARKRFWWLSAIPILIIMSALIYIQLTFPGSSTPISMQEETTLIKELGKALVEPGQFGLVFEIASLLLLVALIGSIYLARDRKSEKGDDK